MQDAEADQIADSLEQLAREAGRLLKNLDYYWYEEGVSQLSIFIDPDLYQYLERIYHEACRYISQCEELAEVAERLRSGHGEPDVSVS